jgi:hypothetical protein
MSTIALRAAFDRWSTDRDLPAARGRCGVRPARKVAHGGQASDSGEPVLTLDHSLLNDRPLASATDEPMQA